MFLRILCVILAFSGVTFATPRLISLSPASTEILFALGSGPEIVGVTTACNFPEEAKKCPKIGAFFSPQTEKILSLSPTRIIGIADHLNLAQNQLKQLGIPVTIYPTAKSIQDVYRLIAHIGALTNKQTQAQNLIQSCQNQVAQLTKKNKHRPTVAVILWAEPLLVVGRPTFISDILALSGAQNCVETTLEYPKLSIEALLKLNPDYLILTNPQLTDQILNSPRFSSLKAVQSHHLITTLNPDLLLRPGPRFPQAIAELEKQWAQ